MKSIKKTYPHKGKADIYDYYAHQYDRKKQVSQRCFKRVIDKFNKRMVEKLLDGYEFNPGNQLGRFRIIRVKRNFNKLSVDWKSSYDYLRQLEAQGYTGKDENNPNGCNWLVFYTDRQYYRYYWRKQAAKIPNKTAYRFDPTDTNKKKLSEKASNSLAFELKIPNSNTI